MYGQQQWSCDRCTYKQSASATRCAMCQNPNPFMVGSGAGGGRGGGGGVGGHIGGQPFSTKSTTKTKTSG